MCSFMFQLVKTTIVEAVFNLYLLKFGSKYTNIKGCKLILFHMNFLIKER